MNELIRMMNAFAVRMGNLIFIFPEAIYENNLKFEIHISPLLNLSRHPTNFSMQSSGI